MKAFSRFTVSFPWIICFSYVSLVFSPVNSQNMKKETKSPWFTVHPVTEGVFRIEDHGMDNFYLVEGKEKALLIDTGTGVADVRRCVDSLTSLPILVVNTHGHPDHAGGNFQFDSVFAHPGDWEMICKVNSAESHGEWVRRALQELPEMDSIFIKTIDLNSLRLKPLNRWNDF